MALIAILAWRWWQPPATAASTMQASPAMPVPAYVDNQTCLGCHQDQADAWRGSHHAQAMVVATPASVRGNFDNARFQHGGVSTRFFRRDERYFVRTEGPDGAAGDFEVKYTFGVEPLQQYLIELPGGRLQALQIAWDSPRKRWFHLLPTEVTPPGDVLHWSGRYQTANTMCISCHSTGFEKRYDAANDRFASHWKEPNVSCQSCHGPGERHVQWAALQTPERAAAAPAGARYGLTVDLKAGRASQVVDTCAACHSRRSELTATPVPGQPRLDHYRPSLLTEGLYHADGQQLDEVFVDGSFRQSRMYQKGVSCVDCHNAHTGKLKLAGNAVCTQCHQAQPRAPFAGAAGNFDSPAHHFHKPDSAGAQCAACHMPSKTYMRIQARPDHSLRVPRPDLSVKLGTPNACTNCHADKPAQWAADRVAQWYGPSRRQEPHYGQVLAAARAGEPGGNDAAARLAADAQQPGIVRATALAALRGDASTGASERIAATRDADPEVRAAAADSLAALPPEQRRYALTSLLADPVRAVRIAAAHSLSSLPPGQFDPATRAAFDAALAEYIAAQEINLDMPGAQLNLAVVRQNMGRPDLAERHYLGALKIDPDFTAARANLALLYNAGARNADAERVLVEGLRRMPQLGELQYSLGLLLAEERRLAEAAAALAKAAKLLPQRARVHYNLGLALQQLGRTPAARDALLEAARLDPRDPAAAQALALLFAQTGQRALALEWARRWLALAPGDAQARRLVAESGG